MGATHKFKIHSKTTNHLEIYISSKYHIKTNNYLEMLWLITNWKILENDWKDLLINIELRYNIIIFYDISFIEWNPLVWGMCMITLVTNHSNQKHPLENGSRKKWVYPIAIVLAISQICDIGLQSPWFFITS